MRKETLLTRCFFFYRPHPRALCTPSYSAQVGDNPDDEYELVLGVDPNDRWADEKAAALDKLGLRPVESFPLRLNGYPKQLLQYASFVLCDPEAGLGGQGRLCEWTDARGGKERPERPSIHTLPLYETVENRHHHVHVPGV